MPGMADLTFKMKLVDPDTAPGEIKLQKQVMAYGAMPNRMECAVLLLYSVLWLVWLL
jgi:hypothetical protein